MYMELKLATRAALNLECKFVIVAMYLLFYLVVYHVLLAQWAMR